MGKNEKGEKKRRWFETLPALYAGAFLLIFFGQLLGALAIGVITPLLDGLYQLVKLGTGGLAESDVWITGADYIIFVGIWALTFIWIGCIRDRACLQRKQLAESAAWHSDRLWDERVLYPDRMVA